MAKLFLIRRNLESFAGPMTLGEMKEAYKRMAFGLQDEVSGHCGPWVAFDDLQKIKRYYPEVGKIVNEDMLAGWGLSDHSSKKLIHDETHRIPVRTTARSVGLALVFFAIAVAAFAAAVFMANGGRLSGKMKDDAADLQPADAQGLIDNNDANGFAQYMEKNSAMITQLALRSKKNFNDWIPYLRLHAFANDGELPGFPTKYLRGSGANAAPVDCSESLWRRRFRSAAKQWSMMLGGHKLVRAPWGRLLAWDPHWIKRRASKGWIEPENYYVACLLMADKALASIASEAASITGGSASDWDKLGLTQLRQRVEWQLAVARRDDNVLPPQARADDTLSLWSCYEAARDFRELNRCHELFSQSLALPTTANSGSATPAVTLIAGDQWQLYNDERFGWNVLRLALAVRSPLPGDNLNLALTEANKAPKLDRFTRLDYRAEQRAFKLLAKQNGSPEKIAERVASDFPEVELSH